MSMYPGYSYSYCLELILIVLGSYLLWKFFSFYAIAKSLSLNFKSPFRFSILFGIVGILLDMLLIFLIPNLDNFGVFRFGTTSEALVTISFLIVFLYLLEFLVFFKLLEWRYGKPDTIARRSIIFCVCGGLMFMIGTAFFLMGGMLGC